MKNITKTIIIIILFLVLISASVVFANFSISSKSVAFSKNNDVNNVEEALDDLYKKVNTIIEPPIYSEADTISWDIDYKNEVQEFKVPLTGKYQLEVWGSQGGHNTNSVNYGGYSTGVVSLTKDTSIYLVTGGLGDNHVSGNNISKGGYNGGGNGGHGSQGGAGGGGATHIATTNRGELRNYNNYRTEILIVAGGGGGDSGGDVLRGAGGGYVGNRGSYTNTYPAYHAIGGSQTGTGSDNAESGGAGGFGYGGTYFTTYGGNGGGGGYFGGGGSSRSHSGGGGGSGYIGSSSLLTSNGVTKHMTCYNCSTSTTASTRTDTTTCHNEQAVSNCSKEGTGAIRITYIKE